MKSFLPVYGVYAALILSACGGEGLTLSGTVRDFESDQPVAQARISARTFDGTYGKRESELIFRHFGNHPSFVMFTLGNELGRNEAMFELIGVFLDNIMVNE